MLVVGEHSQLAQLLDAPGAPVTNWREISDEINVEWDRATTEAQREALLTVLKATMDIAETTIAAGSLEVFKKARNQHYKSFIVQESMIERMSVRKRSTK